MRGCRKLISMIVMMAMLATMTPYQALAAEPPSDAAAQENQTVAEEEGQEQEQDTQETIPEDKKESDEGQEDLEEGGEAAPSEDPSEVTSGSDAVDNMSLRMQILKTVTPERARSPHRRLLLRKNPVQKHRRKPPLKQQPRRKARRRLLQSNP